MTFYAEKYAKKLFGIRHVEDALQRLDKFTQEEARMAAAETLTIVHRIDANLEGVGNEVGLIQKGRLFFCPPAPAYLSRLGVMKATEEIRLTVKHVSDINRA